MNNLYSSIYIISLLVLFCANLRIKKTAVSTSQSEQVLNLLKNFVRKKDPKTGRCKLGSLKS